MLCYCVVWCVEWCGMAWHGRVGQGMVILFVVPMELRGTLTRDNENHQPMDHKVQKCWPQNNKTTPTSS